MHFYNGEFDLCTFLYICKDNFPSVAPNKLRIKSSISQQPLSVNNCMHSMPIIISVYHKIKGKTLCTALNKLDKKIPIGIKAAILPNRLIKELKIIYLLLLFIKRYR